MPLSIEVGKARSLLQLTDPLLHFSGQLLLRFAAAQRIGIFQGFAELVDLREAFVEAQRLQVITELLFCADQLFR